MLYLVARHVGPTAAQAIARFQLLQWHGDGQAAVQVFEPGTDHGDAVVLAAQQWMANHFAVAAPGRRDGAPVGLSSRTFKRRFTAATGDTPIYYVQRIRVERAKRALETGSAPIEKISWAVGYEDAASFRRLFKRVTGLTAGRVPAQLPAPRPAPRAGRGAGCGCLPESGENPAGRARDTEAARLVTLNHGLRTTVLVGRRAAPGVPAVLRYQRNERFDAATALRQPPA